MKILACFGTRPEAIKLIPLIYRLREAFEVVTVSSGQHDELLHQVLEFFRLRPDHELKCMEQRPNLEELSINIIRAMGEVMNRENPDLILVQGDTMTVYQSAFLAFLRKIPLCHLEAGLRTSLRHSPFPEEMLRALVGRLADVHLAPTAGARDNLRRENVPADRILVCGNTVVDALHLAEGMVDPQHVQAELAPYGVEPAALARPGGSVLITVHRRENIGIPMVNICRAVRTLARRRPDLLFVWVQHKNPDVRAVISREMADCPANVALVEPLSYESVVYFMKNGLLMMTDSGGIQEEAPSFGKPVLVLRESTERPEIVERGIGIVMGRGVPEKRIVESFLALSEDPERYAAIAGRGNPFGDGRASERILRFFDQPAFRAFVHDYPASAHRCLPREGIDEFLDADTLMLERERSL